MRSHARAVSIAACALTFACVRACVLHVAVTAVVTSARDDTDDVTRGVCVCVRVSGQPAKVAGAFNYSLCHCIRFGVGVILCHVTRSKPNPSACSCVMSRTGALVVWVVATVISRSKVTIVVNELNTYVVVPMLISTHSAST